VRVERTVGVHTLVCSDRKGGICTTAVADQRLVVCAVQVAGFNYQLAYSSQNPVNELPASEKGFYDVFGSAWEWAEDHFAAFPGRVVEASCVFRRPAARVQLACGLQCHEHADGG
jgi:formylglycine-generating enzyme required for sulfatase activity